MSVFGTRPEAIKMCPLVKEFQKRNDEFETISGLVIALLGEIPEEDENPEIDYNRFTFTVLKSNEKIIEVPLSRMEGRFSEMAVRRAVKIS